MVDKALQSKQSQHPFISISFLFFAPSTSIKTSKMHFYNKNAIQLQKRPFGSCSPSIMHIW